MDLLRPAGPLDLYPALRGVPVWELRRRLALLRALSRSALAVLPAVDLTLQARSPGDVKADPACQPE